MSIRPIQVDNSLRPTSLYATPKLIARDKQLADLKAVFEHTTSLPKVAFIVSEGGSGKTRLLLEGLDMASKMSGMTVATSLVDFSDLPTHIANSLALQLRQRFSRDNNLSAFANYDRELEALEKIRYSSNTKGIYEQRERVLAAFESDLRTIAQQQPVVLAADTAERLIYGRSTHQARSWEWLKKLIESCPGLTLLMAGRPEARPLLDELSALQIKATSLEPEVFELADSERYFEAIKLLCRDSSDEKAQKVFTRVNALPVNKIQLAHHYSLGKPIRLALLLDYFAFNQLPPETPTLLEQSYDAVKDEPEVERKRKARQLEADVVNHLTDPRGALADVGFTITKLLVAHKGLDIELLAALIRRDLAKVTDADRNKAARLLNEVRPLSFIKYRERDGRYFLHDEVYDILKRVLTENGRFVSDPEDVNVVNAYYRAKIKQNREAIGNQIEQLMDAQTEDQISEDISSIRQETNKAIELLGRERRILHTELVSYLLRDQESAVKGLTEVIIFLFDGLYEGDYLLGLQLDSEIWQFVAESDPNGTATEISGVHMGHIEGMYRVRRVMRRYVESRYSEVIQLADEYLDRLRTEALYGRALVAAELSIWKAAALAQPGNPDAMQSARDLLAKAINFLEVNKDWFGSTQAANVQFDSAADKLGGLRSDAALGTAYRIRGYINRLQGYMKDAVKDNTISLTYWERLGSRSETAAVLTNRAFAFAEMGAYSLAEKDIDRALKIRTELGLYSQIGLSENTEALINLRQQDASKYQTAITLATQSLMRFATLDNKRGLGLAFTARAEARRRLGNEVDVTRERQLLENSIKDAQEALGIFESPQNLELPRQIDALIELGCSYRNLVRWSGKTGASATPEEKAVWIAECEKHLTAAAKFASRDYLYREVDARVNLMSLYEFLGRVDDVNSIMTLVAETVPSDTLIRLNQGLPAAAAPAKSASTWLQLSKLHMLVGRIFFESYQTAQDTSSLEKATEHYALMLEYAHLFNPEANEHRDVQRAFTEARNAVSQLRNDPVSFAIFKQCVGRAEERYRLPESSQLRDLMR
jgi:hypothetical protein